MFFKTLYEQYGWVGLYFTMVTSGLLLFFSTAGLSYYIFFIWKRQRFVPDYRLNPVEMRRSLFYAAYSILGNGVLMLPFEIGIFTGRSKVYFDFAEHGLLYTIGSVLAVLAVTETLIYWIHRGLHGRLLYRLLHFGHHQFRVPTPMAGVAFHPLDSFGQALPYHICAYLFPLNVWVYHSLIAFVTLWAVLIHDRINWVSSPWVNGTGCHTAHHYFNKYNYGQFFSFWDRLCSTYRDPRYLPEQFFASMPGQKLPASARWRANSPGR